MPEEKRLIAELIVCDQERLATQFALSHLQRSVLVDGYEQLAKAAEFARGKVDSVRVRLRSLRTAKLRQKDSHDLHKLQNALNELAEEIDTITYASEAGKEQIPGPEAIAACQARYQRLEIIRDKLAGLAYVMDSVDDKPGLPSRANLQSDIGEALRKLESAKSNLDDLETHLNSVEGAHAIDQDEIASAKSSASNARGDLKAAITALEKSAPSSAKVV
jgi:predicted  nucleic acid-binding Zn-ribbon protein